jgi:ATP-binding cassette subfamily B protein
MSVFPKVFKYIWPQMQKRKWTLFFIIFLYSIRVFVDFLIVPLFVSRIINIFSKPVLDYTQTSHEVFKILYIIIAIYVAIFIIARAIKFTIYKFEAAVTRDLRDFSFQEIEKKSHTFFSNSFAGSLVTKVRRFVVGFESAFETFVYSFWKLFIVILGSFAILSYKVPVVSWMFGVWVISNIIIVFFLLRRKIRYDLLEAEQDSKISGRLADVFSNILAVKFSSASQSEISSFSEYTKEGERRSLKSSFMGGKMDLVQHGMIVIFECSALYVLITLWLKGSITTGTIVLVQAYMTIISQSLWEFSGSSVRFMKSVSDMKETADIFEIPADILEPEIPEKLVINNGHIIFDQVVFKYHIGGNVLDNFNLTVAPGERIGIVGHSGAGKSTITKILLRFNDVTTGAIKIDGQDIRNVTQNDLHSVISYVPQEPILFHRSIRENINYGRPFVSEEKIIEVSKKAHAHEFISKLQQGYDTLVGERGVKLSGGERQRVAIARAMLKDSPILVLDEATSSLDSISESYIQDAFEELMKGKTTIVIAHRLSTIQKMDRIIVLDKGKIAEEGTHKELLTKNGVYADLWNHQTGGFLE